MMISRRYGGAPFIEGSSGSLAAVGCLRPPGEVVFCRVYAQFPAEHRSAVCASLWELVQRSTTPFMTVLHAPTAGRRESVVATLLMLKSQVNQQVLCSLSVWNPAKP